MANFTVCLTHDVDRVYKSYQYLTHDLAKLKLLNFGNLLRKKNPYWNFQKIISIEKE